MRTTPKKGDIIVEARAWNANTIKIRKLLVRGWGKKEATFVDIAKGENAKFAMPISHIDHPRCEQQFGTDIEDLQPRIEIIKGLIRERRQSSIRCSESWLADYASAARADVVEKAKARLQHEREQLDAPISVEMM